MASCNDSQSSIEVVDDDIWYTSPTGEAPWEECSSSLNNIINSLVNSGKEITTSNYEGKMCIINYIINKIIMEDGTTFHFRKYEELPKNEWESLDPRTSEWVPYNDEQNALINQGFNNGEASIAMTILTPEGWRMYIMNLQTMQQINQEGGARDFRQVSHGVDPNDFHVTLVLDESGSMERIRKVTVAQVNSFVQERARDGPHSKFTAIFFSDKIRVVDNGIPMKDVESFEERYSPQGQTAMNDAIGKAIDLCKAPPNRQIIAILTDGHENASRTYSKTQIKTKIRDFQDKGGSVFFLAADQDAVFAGSEYGVKADNCTQFASTPSGTKEAIGTMSDKVCEVMTSLK